MSNSNLMSHQLNISADLPIDEFVLSIERDLKETGDSDVNKTITILEMHNKTIER